MSDDKIAVNKRTALKMFWDAGYNTEGALLHADYLLSTIPQASSGYWLAEDISNLIDKQDKMFKSLIESL